MSQGNDPEATGQRLVADFQSVLITLATAQAASHEAERSETALMQQLSAASRGIYLQPQALSQTDGDHVVRASLDAHIKKVQAEQLKSMSQAQVNGLAIEDQTVYKGKKVRITSLAPDYQPFDAVWLDQRTGYRTSPFKKKLVEGVIEEVALSKNMLVIKPKKLLRMINTNLQFYLVYPINPASGIPAVDIMVL